MLGRNVSTAFGYCSKTLGFLEWEYNSIHEFDFAIVPHASGRNHWYNSEPNRERAEQFWRNFLVGK